MSKFFSDKYKTLKAYTPGEQPRDMKYIKLNTNESPYPPSKNVEKSVAEASNVLSLYPDPECSELTEAIAKICGVGRENVLVTNGSDEALNFAFMAYGDSEHPFVFADITYGFYSVFCQVNQIPYEIIPLDENFRICAEKYVGINKNIVIANPNAPTGIGEELDVIEKIVESNPKSIVIVDEAYVDFGGKSAIELTKKYSNLLVVQTFSKSRSMAGARLGFAVGNKELICDLNTIKYSTNPYNINRLSMAAGLAVINDNDYYMDNCKKIIKTREYTKEKLKQMGFDVTNSLTNFLFAKTDKMSGKELYTKLREKGFLVRRFDTERICEYNRITIGTQEQMEALVLAISDILKEAL